MLESEDVHIVISAAHSLSDHENTTQHSSLRFLMVLCHVTITEVDFAMETPYKMHVGHFESSAYPWQSPVYSG